jgi:Cu+-exporting ATPase
MTNSPPNIITLTVPGMGSDHCAGIVRKTLECLDGVGDIQTNIANHHVSVTLEEGGPDGNTLKKAVEGAGYDVAIEAADVTLVRGELTGVVEAMQLSRATFGKIVQNLIWASAYNVAAIPIAAIGLLHPMIGVIAMTASSLSVIGNSLLLKRRFASSQSIGESA